MRREMLLAALVAAVLLVGCSGESEPPQPANAGAETESDDYMNNIFAETRRELEPRAEQGHAKSQRELGMMYYLGQGVPRDYDTARKWFLKAADQGEHVAQLSLGVINTEGHGVEQDFAKAYMWLTLSAAQENPGAITRLEALTPRMSPEQLAEGRKLVEEWNAAHP